MTDRLAQREDDDTPDHVAVVFGNDARTSRVRDFYVWCSELGVETATVCLPGVEDRRVYSEAVEDLEPRVIDGTTSGSESGSGRYMCFMGGREEVTAALRRLAEDVDAGRIDSDDADSEAVEDRLGIPEEPDLLIDVSGDSLSDVLVWQTVYSELCYPDELDRQSLVGCLEDYEERERRYGR